MQFITALWSSESFTFPSPMDEMTFLNVLLKYSIKRTAFSMSSPLMSSGGTSNGLSWQAAFRPEITTARRMHVALYLPHGPPSFSEGEHSEYSFNSGNRGSTSLIWASCHLIHARLPSSVSLMSHGLMCPSSGTIGREHRLSMIESHRAAD